MATGYTVDGPPLTGSAGSDSSQIIISSVGMFLTGDALTCTSSNAADVLKGAGGEQGTGSVILLPGNNGTSTTLRVNAASGGPRLITITNNRGWTDAAGIPYNPLSISGGCIELDLQAAAEMLAADETFELGISEE